MKTKALVLIAGAAIVTLSFSFVTSNRSQKQSATKTSSERVSHSEPVGGFGSEDKF